MATQLDLADAQFTGFRHAKDGFISIIGLVESMGLTKTEWVKWKDNCPLTTLSLDEIDEIDKYFGL